MVVPHPSFIGVAIACGGNLLISLALNCQKLAHKRIDEQASSSASSSTSTPEERPTRPKPNDFSFPLASCSSTSDDELEEDGVPVIHVEPATPIPCLTPGIVDLDENGQPSPSNHFTPAIALPTNHAVTHPQSSSKPRTAKVKIKDLRRTGRDAYGRDDPAVYKQDLGAGTGRPRPVSIGVLESEVVEEMKGDIGAGMDGSKYSGLGSSAGEVRITGEERRIAPTDLDLPSTDGSATTSSHHPGHTISTAYQSHPPHLSSPSTSDPATPPQTGPTRELYLRSKLWWSGLLLMSIGEGGNFLSYGFAPASVVAPLGTVALIANCFLSPLILGERFEWKDLLGVALAIVGAVTVVLSAETSDPSLSPESLLVAISQPAFIVYTAVTAVAILTLLGLTHSRRFGGRWLGVDLGLCALFGGYTVLSTKALSSLVSRIFFAAFQYPITWALVVVLAGTSVLQIKYLNRALMEFESKEVIPTQFVFFSISAIVGSAVLYQEFRDVTVSRMANFLFGIATTFVGVFLLTATSKSTDEGSEKDEEEDEDEEGGGARSLNPPTALLSRRSSLKSHRSQLSPIAERAVLIPSRPIRGQTQDKQHYQSLVFPGKHAMRKRSSTTTLGGGGRGLSSGGFLLLATSPSTAGAGTNARMGGRSRSNSRGRGGQDERRGVESSPA